MRPTLGRIRVLLAAAVISTTAAGGAGAYYRVTGRVPPPQPPVLSFTQDTTGVHVRIHNVNDKWGLRNQPVRIWLVHADGGPINVYGPDMDTRTTFDPHRRLHCCLITYLAPRGEYTFDLLPAHAPVGRVTITMRGGDQWIRM